MDDAIQELTAEEVNALPILRYTGEIRIVGSYKALKSAIEEITCCDYVGLDTESRPSFTKGEAYPISLLQIATPKRVYLIRMAHIGIPNILCEFFSSNVKKVGLGLVDDLRRLKERRDFKERSMVDLAELAKTKGHTKTSLRALCAHYLGKRITKSARTTNWSRKVLTEQQLNYAATDAWVCLLLKEYLLI